MSGPRPLGAISLPARPQREARIRLVVGLLVIGAVTCGLAGTAAAQEEPEPVDADAGQPAPDSTVAPEPTDATTTTLADLSTPGAPTREAPLTDSEKASRTIGYVVIALLVLAVIVLVATVVFWRRTRPRAVLAAEVERTATARTTGLPPLESGTAPVPATAGVAAAVAVNRSGVFDTDQRVVRQGATPAAPGPTEPGSWSAVAAAAGIETARQQDTPPQAPETTPAQLPPPAPTPAFESRSTASWASQGWGDRPPSVVSPKPAEIEGDAPQDEDEDSVEPEEPEVLPPGFFGRSDDPAESGHRSKPEGDAPDPFTRRR